MRNIFLISIIIVIFNYLISISFAGNSNYLIAIQRNEKDKPYREYNITIQKDIDNLVNDRLNDIYSIIEKNINTYILENGEIDKKLDEIDSVILAKRNNENFKNKKFRFINKNTKKNVNIKNSVNMNEISLNSDIVVPLSPTSNYYVASAYLSDETAEKVKKLKNIISVEKVIKSHSDDSEYRNLIDDYDISFSKNKITKNEGINYDFEKLLEETSWKDVIIQSIKSNKNNYFSHLSLISQDRYKNTVGDYDNNFYFPDSAGKNVDIYFIDDGFYDNKSDFNTNGGERTITCDALFINNNIFDLQKANHTYFCSIYNEPSEHGNIVMSVAGGKVFGVAKRANLHMLGTKHNVLDEYNSLNYILEHGKPNKSIISISRGGYEYYKILDDKIKELINKGFIIIASAGNENENSCYSQNSKSGKGFRFYSGYKDVITVGATRDTDNINIKNAYEKADYSNSGDCVVIHAPGQVISVYPNGKIYIGEGTSFSAPIVAGVAASIISEFPQIKFDNKTMKDMLIKLSLKGILSNIPSNTPNRFLNNGKRLIFSSNISSTPTTTNKKTVPTNSHGKCGSEYGACSKGYCCSKYGYCGTDSTYCDNGCQNEFGTCNIKPTKTTKSTNTTKKSTKSTKKSKSTSTKKKIPTSTINGRCGPNYGACAKEGYCCSKYNYCGKDSDYCGNGCQSDYGFCK